MSSALWGRARVLRRKSHEAAAVCCWSGVSVRDAVLRPAGYDDAAVCRGQGGRNSRGPLWTANRYERDVQSGWDFHRENSWGGRPRRGSAGQLARQWRQVLRVQRDESDRELL